MSKIKNDGLGQYGAEPFKQQQFGTAGIERVKLLLSANSKTYMRRRLAQQQMILSDLE